MVVQQKPSPPIMYRDVEGAIARVRKIREGAQIPRNNVKLIGDHYLVLPDAPKLDTPKGLREEIARAAHLSDTHVLEQRFNHNNYEQMYLLFRGLPAGSKEAEDALIPLHVFRQEQKKGKVLRENLKQTTSMLEETDIRLNESISEAIDAKQQNKNLKSYCDSISTELSFAKKQLSDATAEVVKLEDRLMLLKNIPVLEEQIADLNMKIAESKAEYRIISDRYSKLDFEASSLRRETQDLTFANTSLTMELQRSIAEQNTLDEKLSDSELTVQQFKKLLLEKDTSLEVASDTLNELKISFITTKKLNIKSLQQLSALYESIIMRYESELSCCSLIEKPATPLEETPLLSPTSDSFQHLMVTRDLDIAQATVQEKDLEIEKLKNDYRKLTRVISVLQGKLEVSGKTLSESTTTIEKLNDQLREVSTSSEVTSLKNQHKEDLKNKNKTIQQLESDFTNKNSTLRKEVYLLINKDKENTLEIETLAKQNTTLQSTIHRILGGEDVEFAFSFADQIHKRIKSVAASLYNKSSSVEDTNIQSVPQLRDMLKSDLKDLEIVANLVSSDSSKREQKLLQSVADKMLSRTGDEVSGQSQFVDVADAERQLNIKNKSNSEQDSSREIGGKTAKQRRPRDPTVADENRKLPPPRPPQPTSEDIRKIKVGSSSSSKPTQKSTRSLFQAAGKGGRTGKTATPFLPGIGEKPHLQRVARKAMEREAVGKPQSKFPNLFSALGQFDEAPEFGNSDGSVQLAQTATEDVLPE